MEPEAGNWNLEHTRSWLDHDNVVVLCTDQDEMG